MLVNLICPQCGGKMEVDDSKEKAFCTFCGAELANFHQKIDINQNVNLSGTVTTKQDRSLEPNLYIEFSAEEPDAKMIITFDNNKMKRVILNGHSASMRLPLGHCVAKMDLAGKSYKRDLYIVEQAPVRVNASAFGRREIVIEQPDYEIVQPKQNGVQSVNKPQTNGEPKKKKWWIPLIIIGGVLLLGIIGAIAGTAA